MSDMQARVQKVLTHAQLSVSHISKGGTNAPARVGPMHQQIQGSRTFQNPACCSGRTARTACQSHHKCQQLLQDAYLRAQDLPSS